LGTKEIKTYRLTFQDPPQEEALNTQPAASPLREHEEELLNFLKEKIAKERDHLYLHEIEDYATKYSTSFNNFWQKWTRLIKEEGEALGFFESTGNVSFDYHGGRLGLSRWRRGTLEANVVFRRGYDYRRRDFDVSP